MATPSKRRFAGGGGKPAVDVGEQAPIFTLRHTFDVSISLAELLEMGPVVVAFYVFDFGHV